jgi:GTP-binding protein Era
MSEKTRCGYVAIVGRPKLSITSRKPQTTRHQVLGIKTTEKAQMLFVDTPGIHGGGERALNRFMNRTASAALAAVDIAVMVVDRGEWRDDDERVLQSCLASDAPLVLVINKVDLEDNPNEILPSLQSLAERADFEALIPLSALRGRNLDVLEKEIVQRLPFAPFLFEEDEITDRSTRFLVAEIVREKITRQLGDELPYSSTVEIEEYGEEKGIVHISAVILVERKGQKAILIGQKGSRLRQIGTDARQDIERLIDNKVMLNLWVKVKSGWADDERALRSLGYDDGR